MDDYKKAIKIWEVACAAYLLLNDIKVMIQPQETDSAKRAFSLKKNIVITLPLVKKHVEAYKAPDLIGFYDRTVSFIEVKNYNEMTPRHIYDEKGKLGGEVKQLRGKKRFDFMQEKGFRQGLDCLEITRLKRFQELITTEIIIAFNCKEMLTFDEGRGFWYGTFLSVFDEKKITTYKKDQKFVFLTEMIPIAELIKQKNTEVNLLSFFTKV